jgi:hypothetical protein
MSDEPMTNAAVEHARRGIEILNSPPPPGKRWIPTTDVLDWLYAEEHFTEDFLFENRRSIIGVKNEGGAAWMAAIEATWQLSRTQPQWTVLEVIAVRGERTAACVIRLDYGDDTTTDSIGVTHLDADLQRARRYLQFDLDDRDAAIAEVERLHAESGE